jgi:hypothetical protein
MNAASANWLNAVLPLNRASLRPVHRLSIAGYARTLSLRGITPAPPEYGWLAKVSGGGAGINGAEPKASNHELQVEVLDKDRQITADIATMVFPGKTATLSTGFEGLGAADFLPYGSYIIKNVEAANSNLRYRFNLRDPGLLLEQNVFLTGDLGYATSDRSPLTLTGDPMAILLNVLETQCGYSAGQINMTAVNAYQTGLFNGLQMRFSIRRPSVAKDWLLQEIFAPLSGYFFWNADGLFTPVFLQPEPAASLMTLDDTNTESDPLPVIGYGPYVAALLTMMDYDGSNFTTGIEDVYAPAVAEFGIPIPSQKQSRGLQSASGGALASRLAHYGIFRRFGTQPRALNVKSFWAAMQLEIGDAVSYSNPWIPDVGGTIGIVGKTYEVLNAKPDWEKGQVDLSLLDVSWKATNPLQIAPNGTPNWAGSSAAQRAQYAYFGEGQVFY